MREFITRRWLPGPVWLHFVVLGSVLFVLNKQLFPEPLPVLGPPKEVRLAALEDNFARMAGRLPNEEEQARFVDLLLREELLFRIGVERELYLADPAVEQRIIRNMRFVDPSTDLSDAALVSRGLELNMHLTDEVIRRRVVQVMEQLLVAAANLPEPTEAELRTAYETRKADLTSPATVSFSHVFLGERSEEDVQRLLDTVRAQGMSHAEALPLGTAFLAGFEFTELGWPAVASRLGREFSDALKAQVAGGAQNGEWLAPIASVFGQHLVMLRGFNPERPLTFEEARKALLWELKTERDQGALDTALAQLMQGYEVRRS